MKFLFSFSSLRTFPRFRNYPINQFKPRSNQLNSIKLLCTKVPIVQKNEIILNENLKRYLKNKDDHEKIKIILSECNPNEEESKYKTLDKMTEVFFNSNYTFENNGRTLNDEQIKELLNEYEILKSKRLVPPKFFTDEIFDDLAKVWDNKKRTHFLAFQGIKQLKKFKNYATKQIKTTFRTYENKQLISNDDEDLSNSSVFNKQRKKDYNQHIKLWNSAMDGQNLILDFSFSNDRMKSEQNSIVSQTQRIIFHNIESDQPFNIWFTGLSKESKIYERLVSINLFSPRNFINQTEQHYSELFPKDRLIYLSPDAEETIDKFDSKAIYIIGCIVDRYDDQPLSLNSAKQHNIRSVRLPLEKHILLSGLATDLSFLNVFQMLNYMQFSFANWENAFRMYLQNDRKINEFELIDKFNPSLKLYSRREIENYNKKMKYQYAHRIFKKMNN